MKKNWDVSHIEVIHAIVSEEEYKQTLDDSAEIVYRDLCQLSEIQNATVSETLIQRTGTND